MKARVGILTMHRVVNYGSALQAYATQHIVESMGYDSEIIDYEYPNVFQYERGEMPPRYGWKSRLAKAFGLSARWRKANKFETFRKEHLIMSGYYASPDGIKAAPPRYDIYMTGSDQVWNPRFTHGDTTFLLDFVTGKPKTAYAASFAASSLDKHYSEIYSCLLEQYSSISVREEGGRKIIKDLLGKDVPIVADPTLLLSQKEWGELIGGNVEVGGYILVYMLDYAFDPTAVIYDVIMRLAKETSLKVVSLGKLDSNKIPDCEIIDDAGPTEFIRLFMGASCIVTSSFHGTAFAVNFGKPLFSVVGDVASCDDRQSSFLKLLGLDNCIIKPGSNIDKVNMNSGETKGSADKLCLLRHKSLAYLETALRDCLSKNAK